MSKLLKELQFLNPGLSEYLYELDRDMEVEA